MEFSSEVIAASAAAVSIVSALVSATFSVLTVFQTKASQRLAAHSEIGERYGKLMDFRTSHPEVLALSRKWEASKMKCAYEQVTPEDRQWAIYYCYVELCIAYCNAVLYAWTQKLLDKNAYDNEEAPRETPPD